MSDPDAIIASNITVRFGERTALQCVSLSLKPGQSLALVGPNGSGKTTLLRTLSTLLMPSAGSLAIKGTPIASRAAARSIRRHLAVIFAVPAIDPFLTAYENIFLHARIAGMSSRDARTRSAESLELVGLADRARDRAATLSSGMLRRLDLARALATSPSIIILDEPTTALDAASRDSFWQAINNAKQQQYAVIFATHEAEDLAAADRVCLMHEGSITAHTTPDDLQRILEHWAVESHTQPAVDQMHPELQHIKSSGPFVAVGPYHAAEATLRKLSQGNTPARLRRATLQDALHIPPNNTSENLS